MPLDSVVGVAVGRGGKPSENSALVAQLDRASDYGSEGLGFESLQARKPHTRRNPAPAAGFLRCLGCLAGERILPADHKLDHKGTHFHRRESGSACPNFNRRGRPSRCRSGVPDQLPGDSLAVVGRHPVTFGDRSLSSWCSNYLPNTRLWTNLAGFCCRSERCSASLSLHDVTSVRSHRSPNQPSCWTKCHCLS